MTNAGLPEAVLFDLDGTLFRTETLLETVHRRVFETLREEGLYTSEEPPVERLLGSLGMLLEHIWQRVMPDGSPEAHERANELLLRYEIEELEKGIGELYPGVPETLRKLRERGIRLFVASNGLEQYVKEVPRLRGIADLFEGFYSAGEYATQTKAELVRILLEKHGVRSAWMVGDRSSDVEAGKQNGLFVVGCDYAGFRREGELDGADALIGSFADLEQLIAQRA
ncbi:HAD family hydrolase [Cohnella lubricantis]|uniref:HAD hydrolase-like protein n=1 Tax=Cohnella lubricantis TaxID=2163172 RepID=A0A841TF12_9BACL|nr:HAD family hydrolase [Cohnella lubricantis]MBB6677557.1 HAD hydrolase-like protein [Cohnella lubricantis]MBP2116557.1 HAD superfamily hydrolase (TIGR01549 family) [Cohnella lubricantis]